LECITFYMTIMVIHAQFCELKSFEIKLIGISYYSIPKLKIDLMFSRCVYDLQMCYMTNFIWINGPLELPALVFGCE
jgi:hypothetical protein